LEVEIDFENRPPGEESVNLLFGTDEALQVKNNLGGVVTQIIETYGKLLTSISTSEDLNLLTREGIPNEKEQDVFGDLGALDITVGLIKEIMRVAPMWSIQHDVACKAYILYTMRLPDHNFNPNPNPNPRIYYTP